MLVEKLTRLFFSQENFNKIKVIYRDLKRKLHYKLSEEEFRKILTNNLGIIKGSVVFIHSSANNLYLKFGVDKVLSILIDIVGDEGTILFPCNQLQERAEVYLNRNEVFNIKRTPTKMGLISGLAMKHKNAVRSLHPTNSVVAIGKYAKELISEHQNSIYPCGEKSPYYKIINYNGIIVGLGVGTESLTFTHTVEDILKDKFPVVTRRKKIFKAKVIDIEGNIRIMETLVAHPNTGYGKVRKYMHKYVPNDICQDFKIKGTRFFIANANQLLNIMIELALKNITIYSKEALIEKE